ncbi:MAG: hypothetical protein QS721_04405 [Candidatus Endonucleobacter sp. (ex Gigantidas childressi)]|nr:hypothetical protein [Candidatus Endonucleobacter sp. (ex Gigantidas childressi)]
MGIIFGDASVLIKLSCSISKSIYGSSLSFVVDCSRLPGHLLIVGS